MRHLRLTLTALLWIGLAAALLTGCGAKGQPAEFEQTAGEMKEGPGVFTGQGRYRHEVDPGWHIQG